MVPFLSSPFAERFEPVGENGVPFVAVVADGGCAMTWGSRAVEPPYEPDGKQIGLDPIWPRGPQGEWEPPGALADWPADADGEWAPAEARALL